MMNIDERKTKRKSIICDEQVRVDLNYLLKIHPTHFKSRETVANHILQLILDGYYDHIEVENQDDEYVVNMNKTLQNEAKAYAKKNLGYKTFKAVFEEVVKKEKYMQSRDENRVSQFLENEKEGQESELEIDDKRSSVRVDSNTIKGLDYIRNKNKDIFTSYEQVANQIAMRIINGYYDEFKNEDEKKDKTIMVNAYLKDEAQSYVKNDLKINIFRDFFEKAVSDEKYMQSRKKENRRERFVEKLEE